MTDAPAAPTGTTAPTDPTAPAPTAPTATTPGTVPVAPAAFDWNTQPGMDDDAKGYVTTKGWKSPQDLLGSYRNLEKLTGAGPDKLIKLPTNDDPAAWNEIYGKLGRPETADKYGLPVPEGDKGEFAKVASDWFHKNGLSVKQAQGVTKDWNEFVATQMKAHTAEIAQRDNKQVADLKTEWGANMAAYSDTADRGAEAFGLKAEQINALKQAMGPGEAMKLLFNIGSKLGTEQATVTGDTRGGTIGGMTPAQAVARIGELKKDKGFSERFHKGDVEARNEVARLNQIAYPGSIEL